MDEKEQIIDEQAGPGDIPIDVQQETEQLKELEAKGDG